MRAYLKANPNKQQVSACGSHQEESHFSYKLTTSLLSLTQPSQCVHGHKILLVLCLSTVYESLVSQFNLFPLLLAWKAHARLSSISTSAFKQERLVLGASLGQNYLRARTSRSVAQRKAWLKATEGGGDSEI